MTLILLYCLVGLLTVGVIAAYDGLDYRHGPDIAIAWLIALLWPIAWALTIGVGVMMGFIFICRKIGGWA